MSCIPLSSCWEKAWALKLATKNFAAMPLVPWVTKFLFKTRQLADKKIMTELRAGLQLNFFSGVWKEFNFYASLALTEVLDRHVGG